MEIGEKGGVNITQENDIAVIGFKAGSICVSEEISNISKQIEDFIEQKKPKAVIVDFGPVKFFSSQVLGIIINIRAKTRAYDGEVVISGINPQLYRVFKITNLDKIFRFFENQEIALRELKKD